MPVPAMSRPVVTVIQLPERALRIPENLQSDASARTTALSNSGVCAPTERLPICRRFCVQFPRSNDGSFGFR